jgi:hypothetical protein
MLNAIAGTIIIKWSAWTFEKKMERVDDDFDR